MKPTKFDKLASVYPEATRKHMISVVSYNHIAENPLTVVSSIFLISLVSAILIPLFYIMLSPGVTLIKYVIGFVGVLVGMHLLLYTILNLRAEKRGLEIEEVLPDALHLISQSLRGGSPTHQAINTACKTEFKSLNQELKRVSTEVTLGVKLEDSLIEMTTRVKSEKLKYVVSMMVFAIKSGGKLSGLLESTAIDLKDQSLVDMKVRAEVSKYKIMLMVALIGMVPFLFALVANIITMFSNFGFDLDVSTDMFANMMLPGKVSITEDYFFKFSIFAIIVQMIAGSFVIGAIGESKASRGLKYVPIMIALSLALYMAFRVVLGSMLGGMF